MKKPEKGQTMVEVLVVLVVAAVILVSLITVVLNSLKNAQFAQKQITATKYAQEAMDTIKTIRDRDGNVTGWTEDTEKFSYLWDVYMSNVCLVNSSPGPCYFKLGNELSLEKMAVDGAEILREGFSRYILIEDEDSSLYDEYKTEKKVTVKVQWDDSSGSHESNLQTILVKLQ